MAANNLPDTLDGSLKGFDSDKMNEDLKQMVLSAKNGTWQKVWEILDRNPYIINMIPLERAWSALHQAVFHKNASIVQKILSYKGCDVFIRAKRDRAEVGQLGITPRDLAKKLNSGNVASILERAETEKKKRHTVYVTFRMKQDNDHGNPLFFMALTQYKEILLGAVKLNIERMGSTNILLQVYKYQAKNWVKTQKAIGENMAAFTVKEGTKSVLDDSESFGDFFGNVIQMYTAETKITYNNKPLYRHFNENLRMENCHENGSGMLLSPYIVLFEVALLFWDGVQPCTDTTYRGLALSVTDAFFYVESKGKTIVWLSFTSSSKRKTVAENRAKSIKENENDISTVCTIRNDRCTSTYWSPKVVEAKSDFPDEEEAIYPAGAEFKIIDTAYVNGLLTVDMELVGPVH